LFVSAARDNKRRRSFRVQRGEDEIDTSPSLAFLPFSESS